MTDRYTQRNAAYVSDKTLTEVRMKKKEIENNIKEMLEQFENEYSVEVSNVYYARTTTDLPMQPGFVIIREVNLSIDI